jgi:phosphohistidine phosphatase
MKSTTILPPDRKRLLLCRHAKSSWHEATQSDIERPLNKRGERDAPEMGRRLAHLGIQPDLILTSPAVRAETTAAYLAAELGYPRERLEVQTGLYAATVPSLLTLLQQQEPQCTTLLLVGHNPECTALANMLGALHIENIPTCGIVALEFAVSSWRELAAGTGTLLFFDFPKNNAQ